MQIRNIIDAVKELKTKLNYMSEADADLLRKCDSYQLACMMYIFSLDVDMDDYVNLYNELLPIANEYTKNYVIGNNGISRKVLNSFDKVGEKYV